jgi:hexulose-6-phosphate isomerase
MKRLGIMQGRLSPPISDRIQAFPGDAWRDEFQRCRDLGLCCLEWIFEFSSMHQNPICSDSGISEILSLAKKYDVHVNSLIADYFMEKRLFGNDKSEIEHSIGMLKFLIEQCRKCGIPIIELPFVDSSAIKGKRDKQQIIENLREPLVMAKESDIKISFETSLPPVDFREFILAFRPFHVFVNYDMGNSASSGYDPDEEIRLLGKYIINVHIKDRVSGGGTVPLGEGDTPFLKIFKLLFQLGYKGDFILQAARQDLRGSKEKKDFVETVRGYIEFVREFIGER